MFGGSVIQLPKVITLAASRSEAADIPTSGQWHPKTGGPPPGKQATRFQRRYGPATGVTVTVTESAAPSEAITNFDALGAETTWPPVTVT